MLADPAAFSEAAKYFFEALSGLDDVSDKPITSLIYPCSAITSSFSEHTVIFNLKDVGNSWHCYNGMGPIKVDTQFRRNIRAYCTASGHCLRYGSMGLFKDN